MNNISSTSKHKCSKCGKFLSKGSVSSEYYASIFKDGPCWVLCGKCSIKIHLKFGNITSKNIDRLSNWVWERNV